MPDSKKFDPTQKPKVVVPLKLSVDDEMTPTGLITMRFNRPITLNFAGARRDRNLASLSEDEKVVIYPILKSAF